jgi:tRNA dimethylallyltransferase
VDPELAETVEPNNTKRLVRILEVFEATGRKLSEFQKEREGGIGNYPVFWLQRDRDVLYDRINARVDQMMREGLLNEVNGLINKRQTNALNTVGYKELFDYIDGRWSLDEAVERIKGNTRRYARKQLTWYKRDDDMHWFHPNDIQEILNYLKHYESIHG